MNRTCLILAAIVALPLLAASPSFASVIDLGAAGGYVVLAKTGVTTTATSLVVGNIGASPAAASLITGFGLVADGSGTFSTSSQVTGKVYAADYSPLTPANLTAAVSAMEAAYTAAASLTPTLTGLGGGTLFNQNLGPGVYKWTTTVQITSDLTLTGSASDIWVFQIDQTLDMASGKKVILAGGAQAANVFWQVAGSTLLESTSEFKGIILDKTLIAMQNGATLDGRALAQTAVTLIHNTITSPVPEPCTLLLLGCGLAGLLASRRRSRSAA